MTLICTCPVGSEIPDIVLVDCPEIVGQIQKIIFTRIYSTGNTKNKFVIASANPNVLASWTPKLSASDRTKVVQSPFIENPTFEAGAAKKTGGGNASLGGIQRVVGAEATTFKGVFNNKAQSMIKALKSYMCENVGIFMINDQGRIIGDNGGGSTEFYPIPIHGLFIGDKKIGGLDADDENAIEFAFKANWSDNLSIVTPTNFDALNDLITA